MDITCAHCAEPWDVEALRHDSWGDIADTPGIPERIRDRLAICFDPYAPRPALQAARALVNDWTYTATLSGLGCPACGFAHAGDGPHRLQQLRELVIDGVTDDDPITFF